MHDIGTITSGAVRADGSIASPATAQNFPRSEPVSTRNACPCENPADGPRAALPRIRSSDDRGTGSPVNVRTM